MTQQRRRRRRGVDEARRWASEVGLVPAVATKRWKIHLSLETHGDIPTPVWDLETPRFWLTISSTSLWVVGITTARRELWFKKQAGARGEITVDRHLGYRRLDVSPPTKLASVPGWLGRAEKRLGLRFDRTRPHVRSNIANGSRAVVAWINDL